MLQIDPPTCVVHQVVNACPPKGCVSLGCGLLKGLIGPTQVQGQDQRIRGGDGKFLLHLLRMGEQSRGVCMA